MANCNDVTQTPSLPDLFWAPAQLSNPKIKVSTLLSCFKVFCEFLEETYLNTQDPSSYRDLNSGQFGSQPLDASPPAEKDRVKKIRIKTIQVFFGKKFRSFKAGIFINPKRKINRDLFTRRRQSS